MFVPNNKTPEQIVAELSAPFDFKDIEWRAQSAGWNDRGGWVRILAYVTNRAIQQRLDDVVGPHNWQNVFAPGPQGGIQCGIAIRESAFGGPLVSWITKYDGAANTEVKDGAQLDEDTNIKGGYSASMKRAAVQWGLGRHLYDIEDVFGTVVEATVKGRRSAKTKDGKDVYWMPPLALPSDKKPVPKAAPKVEVRPGTFRELKDQTVSNVTLLDAAIFQAEIEDIHALLEDAKTTGKSGDDAGAKALASAALIKSELCLIETDVGKLLAGRPGSMANPWRESFARAKAEKSVSEAKRVLEELQALVATLV